MIFSKVALYNLVLDFERSISLSGTFGFGQRVRDVNLMLGYISVWVVALMLEFLV